LRGPAKRPSAWGCGGFMMTLSLDNLCVACIDLGIGSEGRNASVSWTVRWCLASASERVKARSHSAGVSREL
jgi:hypothetical protein